MKRVKSQQDILHYTSSESGLSLEHSQILERNLWDSIRHYLSNPLSTKKGILLSGSIKFYPKPENLYMAKTLSKNEVLKEIYEKWYKQIGKSKETGDENFSEGSPE